MSERSQHNAFLHPAPADQDVVALIKKMQQQLVFLEKKIDILINQSQARPFSEKHFSKSFRSFGHPHRHSDREHDTASGEKSSDRGRHFEKRHGEKNQSFGYKRKAYDNSRESDVGQEHHFEKRQGGEKRGFDQKKKPFYYRRKDRG
jgi:hypothetical protein